MKEYSLNLQGYYKQGMTGGIPSVPGIYVVYRGVHDMEHNLAILKELLFIGETSNLEECINDTAKLKNCSESLQESEVLFFCFSSDIADEQNRRDVTKMLVSVTLPTLNDLDTEVSEPEGAVINIEGNSHAFLPSKISIA